MSLWIKLVMGAVVFISIVVVWVFQLTSGVSRAADAFFHAVGNKDMVRARSFLAEGFRASMNEAQLHAFLKAQSIAGFREARWSSRSIENGRGALSGSIITDTGGVVPLRMELVKEHGAWRIYAIRKQSAGVSTSAPTAEPAASVQLPSGAAIMALVKTAMHDFGLSVRLRDMTHFRSTLSSLWQQEATTADLDRVFAPFFDLGVDYAALDAINPEPMSAPLIFADGVMKVEGYYPAGEDRLVFKQMYEQERGQWRLVSFNVKLVGVPDEELQAQTSP